MNISINQNQPIFKRIYTGDSLMNKLKNPACPKHFIKQFAYIRQKYRKTNICKTKYIDLVFDYSDYDGFHMYIISKDKKILSKKDYQFYTKINTSKACIEHLKNWVFKWDSYFKDNNIK